MRLRDRAGLSDAALARLMPLYLLVDAGGVILGHGPLIGRIADGLTGARLFDRFALRRPVGAGSVPALLQGADGRVQLVETASGVALRGLVVAAGDGALLNLSFGLGVVDAVRRFSLTEADFAPTDLTVELLYLVEANAAVQAELRSLNLRLQGARDMAQAAAMTDPLTGLANRRAVEVALADACAGAGAFALLHLDLDHFKAVNDRLGHAAGDHVLRCVAQVLRAETRGGDTVARIGGDEFVVLIPAQGAVDTNAIRRIADRIIAGVAQPIRYEGQPCTVAASIGIALSSPRGFPDPDKLLRQADDALYAAKRAGRGCAVLAETV